MYGLLRSALLFYLKLVEDLKADGFVLNEYDPCVANKIVNAVTGVLTPKQQGSTSVLQRRSVLGKVRTGAHVAWNTSHNRTDGYNEKARMRHVELVVARILRERNRTANRRSRGYG